MTTEFNDGGPAFPCEGGQFSGLHPATGMSLRDWFAGQALAPFITWNGNERFPANHDQIAVAAYKLADAMLAARNALRRDN